MIAHSEEKSLTFPECVMRAATAEWSKSKYSIGCGAGRAYIGVSDDGRIGANDGKSMIYRIRDEGED